MATSPSDQENSNVLGWLDRLQSSVQDAGNTGGPSVFTELRNKEKVESDGDSDGPTIEFVSPEGEDCDDASSEAEKIQASLPDAHVPLGLIANLSIHSGKAKGKKDGGNITDEDLNDDNVVRLLRSSLLDLSLTMSLLFHRGWLMKHTSCQVP